MKKNKLVNGFIIGTFVMLYILVSLISTIHVIDFFEMSNPRGMAIALAVAFEVGAAASLASLITLEKMNKTLVWALFIAITAMQMQGNMFYAFKNLEDFQSWVELFNLIESEPLFQKRVLAFVSGAILPLVALGFIKSLVDYIKPEDEIKVIEEDVNVPGKLNSSDEEVIEDDYDWADLEDDSDEKLMRDFEFDNEEWDDLSQEEWNDIVEYQDMKTADREKFADEDFDEDHALDQVMNSMVDDLDEEFDKVEEGYNDPADEEIKIPSVEQVKETIKPKPPVKDVDEAYRFGKNLYQTMVKKVNSDHLQIDAKPSAEQISKAYRNLGLVDKDKR